MSIIRPGCGNEICLTRFLVFLVSLQRYCHIVHRWLMCVELWIPYAIGTMSGSSYSPMPPEHWLPGQDHWVYLPNNDNWNRSLPQASDFIRRRSSLNPGGRMGDPWSLPEERGGSNGSDSFPSTTPPSLQLTLVDNHNTYPRIRYPYPYTPTYNYEPTYNQTPRQEESSMSKEDQTKALSKLRKQIYYSPHLSRIIKRLGAKSTGNEAKRTSLDQDDDGKGCTICLEDFKSREFVMLTPCNHMFHEECIVRWVKNQGKCPVCRFVMAEKNGPRPNSNNATMRGGIESGLASVMRGFDAF